MARLFDKNENITFVARKMSENFIEGGNEG